MDGAIRCSQSDLAPLRVERADYRRRPLDLDGDTRGIISLDHAIWFHRSARADEWLFYDAHSLVNTLGRGLLRGSIYGPDRQLTASVTQETLLRPYDQFTD